jgi:hypothetical protein
LTRDRFWKRISSTGFRSGATATCWRLRSAAYSSGGSESCARRSATLRAASSPSGVIFVRLSKSPVEKSPSSGEIRMSVGIRLASEACTFCSVRMLSIWLVMPKIEFSSSRLSSGVPTLTAITMSAPIARAACTGRLLVSMPSTSIMPRYSVGATAPGTDMLARITLASSPSSNTTSLPVTRSVAMARKGIGRSSKRWKPCTRDSSRSTVSSCTPVTTPLASEACSEAVPISTPK